MTLQRDGERVGTIHGTIHIGISNAVRQVRWTFGRLKTPEDGTGLDWHPSLPDDSADYRFSLNPDFSLRAMHDEQALGRMAATNLQTLADAVADDRDFIGPEAWEFGEFAPTPAELGAVERILFDRDTWRPMFFVGRHFASASTNRLVQTEEPDFLGRIFFGGPTSLKLVHTLTSLRPSDRRRDATVIRWTESAHLQVVRGEKRDEVGLHETKWELEVEARTGRPLVAEKRFTTGSFPAGLVISPPTEWTVATAFDWNDVEPDPVK